MWVVWGRADGLTLAYNWYLMGWMNAGFDKEGSEEKKGKRISLRNG